MFEESSNAICINHLPDPLMSWEDDLKLHVISTCSLPSTYIYRFGSLLLANPAFPAIPHLLQVRPYYIGEQVFSAGLVSLYI